MDDQNKKQIVIIVVIIIVLVLMLLGVLIVAVVTNKVSGTNLSNNTTTTTLSTTLPTTTLPVAEESSSVDENLVLQGIETYLYAIKTDGLIGEYNIGKLELKAVTDQSMLCPSVTYDSTKIYADVILSYVKIPDAPPLVENEEVVGDRASISISFALSFDGSAYIVDETFSC